jgi:Bacterial capsule synthesis protein PGA_cap
MKIALLGDIAFFGKFCKAKNNGLFKYFEDIAVLLMEYDFVIGNLETPFVSSGKPFSSKSAYIKADPKSAEILNFLNIGAVNLANNHIYDYGMQGYSKTIRVLNDSNVKYFGTEGKQIVLEKDGIKLALHGYCCYSTNPLGLGKIINTLDISTIEKKLQANRNLGYFNIVSIHCGQEHINVPNYDHVRMARQFTKFGPYCFHGHHPHVMQGIENINGSLIAYSLGNFCFDDVYTKKSIKPLISQTEENKTSFILELNFEPNSHYSYKVIPIFLGADKLLIAKKGTNEKLDEYSRELRVDKVTYVEKRKRKLQSYIDLRKKKRDIKWYIKRLNYSSLKIILNALRNSMHYKKAIRDQLQ